MFFESDIAALAQEQFYFDPLHGSSGHHRAWRGLGVVVHDLTTWRVPLGGKLQGHLEWAGACLELPPVADRTALAADRQLSTDWQRASDDSWGSPDHQDLAKITENVDVLYMVQVKNYHLFVTVGVLQLNHVMYYGEFWIGELVSTE